MTKFDTLVTQLGRNPKRDFGSVNPPIHRTSTLVFDDFETMQAYEHGKNKHHGYGRHGNETVDRLTSAIAQMEGADRAWVTSSGLAATVLGIMGCVGAGDHILIADSIYASTRKFVKEELPRLGIDYTFYDPTIGAGIAELFKPNTKAVYCESPGSLTFEMQDIPAIAKEAHARGALVLADNTWATPAFMKPFDLGIDVSIQSVTKYMAGHSDLVMGSVSCKNEHAQGIEQYYLNTGPCAGADNVYLVLRGLRTMMVRLKEQEKHALEIAQWIEARDDVKRVLYPALPSDPGHALWKRDLTGASAVFAMELKDISREKTAAFVDALHHFGLGYSWGGYESLITAYRPALMRETTKWDEHCWLIRLNIGLEDIDDLKADLDTAFKAAASV